MTTNNIISQEERYMTLTESFDIRPNLYLSQQEEHNPESDSYQDYQDFDSCDNYNNYDSYENYLSPSLTESMSEEPQSETTSVSEYSSPHQSGIQERVARSSEALEDLKNELYMDPENSRWENRRNPQEFQPFPLDALPDTVREWVEYQSAMLNVNPSGVAMCALSLCGILAGGTVELKLKSSWRVNPVIWVCLIGMSGDGKSPTLRGLTDLLSYYENYLGNQYDSDYNDYMENRKSRKEEEKIPEPQESQLGIKGSMTIEGLLKAMKANPRGLYHIVDEGIQFFTDIESAGKTGSSGYYLSGYNGTPVNACRANAERKVRVSRALWALQMAITPEAFRTVMAGQYKSDGLLARLCLVNPPEETTFQRNADVPTEISDKMRGVLYRLIEMDFGPNNFPQGVLLDSQTREAFENWHEDCFEEKKKYNDSVQTSYLSKAVELLPRVALILHCLNIACNSKPVTEFELPQYRNEAHSLQFIDLETWNRARQITQWIMNETLENYARFGLVSQTSEKTEEDKDADFLLDKIVEFGPSRKSDISRWKYSWKKNPDKLTHLLNLLVKRDLLVCQTRIHPNNKTQYEIYSLAGSN